MENLYQASHHRLRKNRELFKALRAYSARTGVSLPNIVHKACAEEYTPNVAYEGFRRPEYSEDETSEFQVLLLAMRWVRFETRKSMARLIEEACLGWARRQIVFVDYGNRQVVTADVQREHAIRMGRAMIATEPERYGFMDHLPSEEDCYRLGVPIVAQTFAGSTPFDAGEPSVVSFAAETS